MPNDVTTRGYPLPHPENIAVADVVRIRQAIDAINTDIQAVVDRETTSNLEEFINLWRAP